VNRRYLELAERVCGELPDLEASIRKAKKSWDSSRRAQRDQDAYLDSVALNIHAFYSGLEKLFELIARHVDGSSPEGIAWHRDLLSRMSDEVTDIRPAVISKEMSKQLDQYLRFRHLVRNVYATNLKPDKMLGLVEGLADLWPKLSAELNAFSEFLKEVAQAGN
jgi:N6-adenosine-specific RNA methylase IME4